MNMLVLLMFGFLLSWAASIAMAAAVIARMQRHSFCAERRGKHGAVGVANQRTIW
jgi:hypothetical protein